MSTSDEIALVVAVVANVAGIAVAIWMWRRHRRHQRTLRSRHPSAQPVVRVDLVDVAGGRRIRLAVPPGAPEVTVDIVSFRPAEPSGAWEAEPLDEPLVLRPGDEAVLTSLLPAGTATVDVVVAWTARHEAGVAQESRLFRLPPDREEAPVPIPAGAGLSGRAALGLGAILVGTGLLVVASIGDDDGEAAPMPPTTAPGFEPTTVVPDTAPVPSATSASTTAPPAPTSAPTATTSVTTTVPATTSPSTTSPVTGSPVTSSPVTSSTGSPTTSADADGPVVLAEGRIEPCRFGDECLVVGFTIDGFDGSPSEYVCEFDDGSRFTFTFVGDGAEVACATGSPTATITVEVAGVRSETISRP